jgi:hypothetical protein
MDKLSQNKKDIIERFNKLQFMLDEVKQGALDDKILIKAQSAYNRITSRSYDSNLELFKSSVSKYAKIKRSIFMARGLSDDTNLEVVLSGFEKELQVLNDEIESISSPEYIDKLEREVAEKKEKLSIKGGNLQDRVNEFSSLNNLMSYKMNDVDPEGCEIPTIELKPINDDDDDELELAEAEAEAIQIKLKLIQLKIAS